MKTFPDDVKKSIMQAQNNYCKMCLNPIHSYHHKLQNTVANRKKFPIFLNSPQNCVGLCAGCHSNHAHKFRITPQEADVYEEWLTNLIIDLPFSSDEANGITYEKIERG